MKDLGQGVDPRYGREIRDFLIGPTTGGGGGSAGCWKKLLDGPTPPRGVVVQGESCRPQLDLAGSPEMPEEPVICAESDKQEPNATATRPEVPGMIARPFLRAPDGWGLSHFGG